MARHIGHWQEGRTILEHAIAPQVRGNVVELEVLIGNGGDASTIGKLGRKYAIGPSSQSCTWELSHR